MAVTLTLTSCSIFKRILIIENTYTILGKIIDTGKEIDWPQMLKTMTVTLIFNFGVLQNHPA